MSSDIERRIGRVEDALTPPDESKLRRDVEEFEALVRALGVELPASMPTDLCARGTAILDAMVYRLTGCHRPKGPDPVDTAMEQNGYERE